MLQHWKLPRNIDNIIFWRMKNLFIIYYIYNRYMHENKYLLKIWKPKRLFITLPLGFSAIHESRGVDLSFTTADLQNDLGNLKHILQWMNNIWNIHGLVGQSMDHHCARRAPLHQRSCLQNNAKTSETLLHKIYVDQGEKIHSWW